MVRNFKGGKNAKGMGRKHVTTGVSNKEFRKVEEEGEIYAGVTKMLGNGMAEVLCLDGKPRICIIRQKFRGRSKRDNTIDIASWVLVGLREWETIKEGKLEKCDLITVYNEHDINNHLKKMDIDWTPFASIEDKNGIKMIEMTNDVTFIEDTPLDTSTTTTPSIVTGLTELDDEIDISEI